MNCLITTVKEEFIHHFGNKNFTLLRAIICYYRVLNFRVAVLICAMQKTDDLRKKQKIKKKLKLKYCVDIGLDSKVGVHPWVEHYNGLVIGNGVVIGDYCTLYQGITIGQRHNKYPIIGDRVIVYPNAVILGGITVGNDAVVLAGSVVIDDVPESCIVGGNPAIIKKRIGDNDENH